MSIVIVSRLTVWYCRLESGGERIVMGVSKRQTARNRQSIIDAATRLFRQRGVDGVGLNELMKEAGFTQGGFYNHFASKEALVSEVIGRAVDAGTQQLGAAIARSRRIGA